VKRSTSINYLNGDDPGRMLWIEKKMYFILNKINNSYQPDKINNNLITKRFAPSKLETHWQELEETGTPSRKLCDLFWMDLPWNKIKSQLGQINIFDSGCGNGEYAKKISNWSDNRINSYTGIDMISHSNWASLMDVNNSFNFYMCDYINLDNYLKENTNLFITQSSIEHFRYDITFFNYINSFIEKNKRSTIQIHIFPSAPCLWLYGFHGYRQYTKRKASIIFDIFRKNSIGILFELGGKTCNDLHYDFITKQYNNRLPEKRNIATNEYNTLLKKAINSDLAPNEESEPSFYALYIHSYPNGVSIFDK
jgi:hypothetical protein